MSIPFIPLMILFIIALMMMLVGLYLSSKTLATEQRVIEKTSYVCQEIISSHMNVQYTLRTILRKRSKWLLLILSLGLIFIGSLSYLYYLISPFYILSTSTPSSITMPDVSSIHLPQGIGGASRALKRLAQLDPNQYSSEQEYSLWAASACSTAAITEVINAYGYNYRISDILHIEIGQSVISPELGLLKLSGIDRTVAQFGFSTAQLKNAPLDSILSVANHGWPIIVNFPPGRDWSTGHFLVVTGGDSSTILLADSSSYNITSLSHQQFLQDWSGFAVIVMPKDQ
jgi:hypothetical protein